MNDLAWFKSSYSDSGGGHCVEVAIQPDDAVWVRDSKDNCGPVLSIEPATWADFLGFAAQAVDA